MIQQTGSGKYVVVSHKTGKRMSKPMSKKAAIKRLAQIKYFGSKGSK